MGEGSNLEPEPRRILYPGMTQLQRPQLRFVGCGGAITFEQMLGSNDLLIVIHAIPREFFSRQGAGEFFILHAEKELPGSAAASMI